jgi:hypothetical protein
MSGWCWVLACITEARCLGSYMCSWLSDFYTRQNHVKIHIFHGFP